MESQSMTVSIDDEIRILETALEMHIRTGADQKIIDDFTQAIQKKKAEKILTCDNCGEGLTKDSKYEKGFNILMEFWDCLPDDQKPLVHKQLEGLGI